MTQRVTDIVVEDDRWEKAHLSDIAERAVKAALDYLSISTRYEVAILACDDARIAELNADFREKPVPTNVLSWPAYELAAHEDGGTPAPPPGSDTVFDNSLGDIAIAYETCLDEARSAGKPFDNHVSHLIVHGLLHLLGYDHVRDRDATLMEGLETEILGKMGLPDPYKE